MDKDDVFTMVAVAYASPLTLKRPSGVTEDQLICAIHEHGTETTGGLNKNKLAEAARANEIQVKASSTRSSIESALRKRMPIRFMNDDVGRRLEALLVGGFNDTWIMMTNAIQTAVKVWQLMRYVERKPGTLVAAALYHVLPRIRLNTWSTPHVEYVLSFADTIDLNAATFNTLLTAAVDQGRSLYISKIIQSRVTWNSRYRPSSDAYTTIHINKKIVQMKLWWIEATIVPRMDDYARSIIQNGVLWDMVRRVMLTPEVTEYMCGMKIKLAASKTPTETQVIAVSLMHLAQRINAVIHYEKLAMPKLMVTRIHETPTYAHSWYNRIRFNYGDSVVVKEVLAQTVHVRPYTNTALAAVAAVNRMYRYLLTYLRAGDKRGDPSAFVGVLKHVLPFVAADDDAHVAKMIPPADLPLLAHGLKNSLIDHVDLSDDLMLRLTLFPDIKVIGDLLRIEINFVRCGYQRLAGTMNYNNFNSMVVRFMDADVTRIVCEFVAHSVARTARSD